MHPSLVDQASRGDREAFAVLARGHGDRMYAIALRILRDVERAEDAVQAALVTAWRELPQLRDPDRLESWLQQILVRSCYREARRHRDFAAHVQVMPIDGPAVADGSASLADRDEVERGLRRLSTEQRAILVLHHYLGLTPTEIGGTLGIPAGTARSRLHYAHRAMRAALDAGERQVAVAGGSVR